MSGAITEALIDALATAVEVAAPGLRVERGAIVLRAGDPRTVDSVPALAIRSLSSTHEAARRVLRLEDVEGEPDKVLVTWQRARVEDRLVLDLYTPTKTERLALLPIVRDLFYPYGADGSPLEGLRLTLATHHGAAVRYLLEGDQEGDEAALGDGRAHRAMTVLAATSLLTQKVYTRATYSAEIEQEQGL